uniref:M61 family metallopeptidase n=1 Tax=Sphingomonas bacterium TaxID=1895847 RepID=UPI0034A09BEF
LVAAPAAAQQAGPLPMAAPFVDTIPAARDVAWPGTLTLDVDASNAVQGIFAVRETIPVAGPGPLVLLYPEWLPGEHGPTGPIANVAGLAFTANGRPLAWRRDTTDIHAFHLDVPAGVRAVEARFQFLPPHERTGTRVVTAPTLTNIEWNAVSLYPAGSYVRRIPVRASVTWPAGWTGYTALRGTRTGDRTAYETVPYDVLVDSPIFAGSHARQVRLDPAVTLDMVGDTPDQILPSAEVIAAHKSLVVQADRLFGTRHYDHYDFLVATSDVQSDEGLEHHRSSENSFGGDLFTDWDANLADHYVVAHEFTHSWNGKYRRPFDLWTPDYRTPMRDTLLWVYEGQTQFWGNILAARSGLWTHDQYLDNLAGVAALYAGGQPGMGWRPLQDTTNDPIIAPGAGSDWPSWSRGYDYYRNAELVWLEVDAQLRQLTGGARGLDDFAKGFFGVDPGVWNTERTYTFDDVAAGLNAVAPYDWAGFLRARLDATGPASLAGIERGGYRLIYTDKPNAMLKNSLAKTKGADFSYSIGLRVDEKGRIGGVVWNSPAFRAGVKPGDTIVAVADRGYDAPALAAAITLAAGTAREARGPLVLSLRSDDRFRTVSIPYHGGLRYPHLEKIAGGEAGLDRLLAPR